VEQATDLALGRDETRQGTVLLVTDGEELEDEDAVVEAAERAARAGIVVHTVGVGTAEGAPIPEVTSGPNGQGVERYKRDEEGEIVITRLNESLLQRVAEITGGRYHRLGEAGTTDAVLRTLHGLDRTAGESQQQVRARERYAWFVALALALLAIDGIVASRGRAGPRSGEEVARA
jgi:Ca-activated chloride channel family protein